ncbi:hypothetical protein EV426DRAFT_582416 [Tirmania nivea]|nr:hypothetical protein EV426DRAFT_582416 [Tirmania nivea]
MVGEKKAEEGEEEEERRRGEHKLFNFICLGFHLWAFCDILSFPFSFLLFLIVFFFCLISNLFGLHLGFDTFDRFDVIYGIHVLSCYFLGLYVMGKISSFFLFSPFISGDITISIPYFSILLFLL